MFAFPILGAEDWYRKVTLEKNPSFSLKIDHRSRGTNIKMNSPDNGPAPVRGRRSHRVSNHEQRERSVKIKLKIKKTDFEN